MSQLLPNLLRLTWVVLLAAACEKPSDLYVVDATPAPPPGESLAPTEPQPAPGKPGSACQTNAACDSKVCTPEQRCAHPDDVALVKTDVNGNCIDKPCAFISKALDTNRPYILLQTNGDGLTHSENVDLADRNVTLIGHTGAERWEPENPSAPTLTVRAGATVTLMSLVVQSDRAGLQRVHQCVDVRSAKLALVRATIDGCPGTGVRVNNGELILRGATVSQCDGGILAQHSAVQIYQSKIADIWRDPTLTFNDETIASGRVRQPGLYVENSLFVKSLRGVDIATSYPVTFKHATLAQNGSVPLHCKPTSPSAPRPKIIASIITRFAEQEVSSHCDVSASRVMTVISGTINPNFKIGGFSLHPTSDLIDGIGAPCALSVDYAGVARPQGGGCDYGALEAVP